MTTESKKLDRPAGCKCNFSEYMLGDGCDICNPALALRYTRESLDDLMDPSRKTPETPLEKEQREVMRKLVDALSDERLRHKSCGAGCCDAHDAIAAAAPFLED